MKIEELQEKISALDKSNKLIDQKFVFFVKNSDKCTNMLETISEAHALKWKYEEQVDDMGELEFLFVALKFYFFGPSSRLIVTIFT